MRTSSSIGTEAPATATCRTCGRTVPAGTARITGAWSVVAGHASWDCDHCARTHIRDIEAGTDRNYW